MIVKNCDNDKNYKITLYKFNQALVKHNDTKYWVEKYILQNINDMDNIDKLKIKNDRNDLDLINIGNSEIPNYNAEDNLDELDKIENLLEVNIHIFGCNKKFNGKKIIRKSKSDFDKDLDLLLIDDIKHYILIKNINNFISDNSHVIKTCRNCLNVFYSELKYKDHIEYCKFRKPKKLMSPFKKYMKFKNLKNYILNNWVIHSDFECIVDPITKEHSFIAGGYYLECRNNKFSKKVQTFYDLEEYTIPLFKELVYIDNIESNYLQNEIDYSNFNQEEFDSIKICKYCKSEFNHPYNDRYIILYEICDKEKLKYILENNDLMKK